MSAETDTWASLREYVDGWAAVAYVLAVISPLVGVAAAIPVVIRGDWRNCVGVLLLCFVSFAVRMSVGLSYE